MEPCDLSERQRWLAKQISKLTYVGIQYVHLYKNRNPLVIGDQTEEQNRTVKNISIITNEREIWQVLSETHRPQRQLLEEADIVFLLDGVNTLKHSHQFYQTNKTLKSDKTR